MLDCRNAVLAFREREPHAAQVSTDNEYGTARVTSPTLESGTPGASGSTDVNSAAGKPQISLSHMIATSIALKSNLDIEIIEPSGTWPAELFSPTTSSRRSSLTPHESIPRESDRVPLHFVEAMSGLQRDTLLLRNELNFELWISRQNVKHIGRLYQDRILSKNAEAERQGLVRFFIIRSSNQCLVSPPSITSSANTEHKLWGLSESCGSTKSRHLLQRTNMLIGT
jgi:hypothetical protein